LGGKLATKKEQDRREKQGLPDHAGKNASLRARFQENRPPWSGFGVGRREDIGGWAQKGERQWDGRTGTKQHVTHQTQIGDQKSRLGGKGEEAEETAIKQGQGPAKEEPKGKETIARC